jgi:hypothetical protein
MNRFYPERRRTNRIAAGLIALIALAVLAPATSPLCANIIDLYDSTSHFAIDPASQAGISAWEIDGHNYLTQQWWWYRIGDSGPETSIDKLVLSGAPVLNDTNGDGLNDQVTFSYTSAGKFLLELTTTLVGGDPGTGVSDLADQVRVVNKSGSNLDLHLFQYVDAYLSNGADTVQFEPGFAQVTQTGANGAMLELLTKSSQHHEAGLDTQTLDRLNDAVATTLNDTNYAGPGNTTWAFQWDLALRSNGSALISKDIAATVPEPSTLLLLGAGAMGLAAWWWRRRSFGALLRVRQDE